MARNNKSKELDDRFFSGGTINNNASNYDYPVYTAPSKGSPTPQSSQKSTSGDRISSSVYNPSTGDWTSTYGDGKTITTGAPGLVGGNVVEIPGLKEGYDREFGAGWSDWDPSEGEFRSGSKSSSGGVSSSSWGSGGLGSGGNPYEDAIAAQKKALEEAQRNQIASINQSVDEQARKAYINSMVQQRDLNQNLAASGLSGGMSETTKANLMNTYQNNLNDLELQRNNLVNQVNANTTGEFANIESQLADYIAQQQAAERAYGQWQQEFEYQKAEDALARQDALAAQAAKGSGGGKYYYSSDPKYLAEYSGIMSGEINEQDVRNASSYLLNQFGIDAYEKLLKQAQLMEQQRAQQQEDLIGRLSGAPRYQTSAKRGTGFLELA